MKKVEVVPYRPEWPGMFREEAEKIYAVFGNEPIHLHHIGSTSVPDLPAKPIIDLLGEVKMIENVDRFNQQLEGLGYEAMGEFGIPGRRYFRKGGDTRTHHLHIFAEGTSEVRRHLAFRDYLRHSPEKRKAYGRLKMKLAEQYPHNIEKYMDGKDPWIKEIEKEALHWAKDD
ncbi:MAG TPA: GrpB family protein [Bacillales bacterium]|nr:GrpB family protein [Bacillales bacterium]